MALLPQAEQDQLLAEWETYAGQFAATRPVETVRADLATARQRGYAVNAGVVLERNWGMAAAVLDQRGQPAWAVSIAGTAPELRDDDNRQELGRLLTEEARKMSECLGRPDRYQTLSKIRPFPADFQRTLPIAAGGDGNAGYTRFRIR